ncbi:ribosome hibernation-promoting factor, HPF/YfiA family [Campylobacter geochelonis]|uniref:ribosome hibernation-promoting factor, HPF/YfiA family n=1 Tax=Campylobacter geochelonis TaxID=1780362 RepID=UPI000770A0ED|nr:ribosome-associated translation inhibitor RaiA [Campylobacter geochelonis]CZE47621.1 sigma 54 modulation protein/ribosomal protein S30EA [Campylobacter geochelonis]CZE50176.1 sigma 54 modulation protein/ribosomal protein S30EA [Campylobacter geochelonis]
MNISIVGKQFELTDSIKNYVEKAFESLEKYNLNIISGRCVISADEKQGRKGFVVDFSINLAKKDTVVITQKDKDLYAAIDVIVERASKVLRRHHDKDTTHKNKDEKKEMALDKILLEKIENVDEIIPTELETYKPMEADEALEVLKSSDERKFLVFNDMDAKMRVLYRRKDGNFGLY